MAMVITYVRPQAVGFAATDLRKVGRHAQNGLTSKSFYLPSSFTFWFGRRISNSFPRRTSAQVLLTSHSERMIPGF